MSAPLLLAALLALPASAAEGRSVDLSDQFDETCRSQGKVGACHAFASVELLQAAIKRRHGRTTRLSSADLFVRVALKDNRPIVMETAEGKAFVAQIETGSPQLDIAHALREGVAHEEDASWADFLERYEERQEERAVRCEEIVDAADGNAACRRQDLREYMRELGNESAAEREKRLLGDAPALAAGRRETKGLLAGLTLSKRRMDEGDFDAAGPADIADRAVCREKGRKQTELLTARLDERLPVAICFVMDGLPGWDGNMKKKSGERHCVAVKGYRVEGEGAAARKAFKIRNSWGAAQTVRFDGRGLPSFDAVEITHDIGEDHACAIVSAVWLSP